MPEALMVTHDLVMVARADRVLEIGDGQLIAN
jgi:predicted ABC-type transport system involved in lysophospholipase L1 biosynthesis ATPase subunit